MDKSLVVLLAFIIPLFVAAIFYFYRVARSQPVSAKVLIAFAIIQIIWGAILLYIGIYT